MYIILDELVGGTDQCKKSDSFCYVSKYLCIDLTLKSLLHEQIIINKYGGNFFFIYYMKKCMGKNFRICYMKN